MSSRFFAGIETSNTVTWLDFLLYSKRPILWLDFINRNVHTMNWLDFLLQLKRPLRGPRNLLSVPDLSQVIRCMFTHTHGRTVNNAYCLEIRELLGFNHTVGVCIGRRSFFSVGNGQQSGIAYRQAHSESFVRVSDAACPNRIALRDPLTVATRFCVWSPFPSRPPHLL